MEAEPEAQPKLQQEWMRLLREVTQLARMQHRCLSLVALIRPAGEAWQWAGGRRERKEEGQCDYQEEPVAVT